MNFKDFDNAFVLLDNYNKDKNNKILILAEHSGSTFPGEIQVSDNDDLMEIFNKKLHYEVNTLEVSQHLNKKFNSILVFNKYSHLLCDPCLDIADINLIPLNYDNKYLKFNKLSFAEQELRISNLFLGYHIALRYIEDEHNLDFVVSLHSHEDKEYDFIIDCFKETNFSNSIIDKIKKLNYKILVQSKNINPRFTSNYYLLCNNPKREGFVLSFQRDMKDTEVILEKILTEHFNN